MGGWLRPARGACKVSDMAVAVGPNEEVIGRADELAAVEGMLERAATELAALALEGEAGIGKTALWQAGRMAAQRRGFRVLSSRPARSEAQLPLGVFGDLFSQVPAGVLARLPGPQRQALEAALLRIDPDGAAADQRALSVATLGLIRELAGDAPVLLALDDVQWVDESSGGVLSFAFRRLEGVPVGVLLTLRQGVEPRPFDPGSAFPEAALERSTVGLLSLAVLHRLFEARLGRSFPRLVLLKIEKASGGNPFYALEIGHALMRRGTDIAAGEPLPVPDGLATLTGELLLYAARSDLGMRFCSRRRLPFRRSRRLSMRALPSRLSSSRPAVRERIVSFERGLIRSEHPLLGSGCPRVGGRRGAARASSPAGRGGSLGGRTGAPSRRGGERSKRGGGSGPRAIRGASSVARRLA